MKKKTLATKIGAALMSAVLAVSMAACSNDGASQGSSSQEDTSLDGSQSESGNQDSGESSGDSGENSGDASADASGSEDAGDGEASGDGENQAGGAVVLHEPKDLGGRTIKIGLWWDEYWDSNYQTLEDVTAAGGSYSNSETMQMKLDKIREIESRWNCKIEWVNLGWDGIMEKGN